MPTVDESLVITCSADTLFKITHNYAIRTDWDPFSKDYTFLDEDPTPRKGLRFIVHANNGLDMTVEYISFHPGKVAAIRMIKGPWFFKSFAGSWKYKMLDKSCCEVTFRYHFEIKPLVAWFMNTMITRSLTRHTKQRLTALKNYCEKLLDGQKPA